MERRVIPFSKRTSILNSMHDLITGCKHKNPARQRELFGLFAPRMMTVARRYAATRAEAEDVLQEAFVKIFRSFDQFEGSKGALEAWIRRIVVNTAIGHWRRRHRHFPASREEYLPDQPAAAEADTAMDAEELLQLIATLPPGFRIVFNLYAIEGYSHTEIAALLGITESTSRSQLARARKQLQEAVFSLQKNGMV